MVVMNSGNFDLNFDTVYYSNNVFYKRVFNSDKFFFVLNFPFWRSTVKHIDKVLSTCRVLMVSDRKMNQHFLDNLYN